MSKPLAPGQSLPHLAPAEQIQFFVDLYRRAVNPAAHARLTARVRDLGLNFPEDELLIIAALGTPARVQGFLNTQIYYNFDHTSIEQDETAAPPRRVLQTGVAHCFEGAMFAYAVNFLHDHSPCLMLLEASQDSEHNLVICQDPQTGLYGANAHSSFPHLDGRPAHYPTLRALAESYVPYYYSDRTNDPSDLTLVGYSDPFDLVAKYGTAWIASDEPLWDIYYTYIDDTLTFHYLFDDSNETHLYPLVRALKSRWIQMNARGKPFVSVRDLPPAAQELWQAFWRAFDPNGKRPHDAAREIEKQFMRLAGTTPIDLQDNAEDLQYFIERGYRIEQQSARSIQIGHGRTRRAMTEKPTTRARKNLGESGERIAALFLEQRGYKILARNFRTRVGEIDLVAEDADGLAFVEVRTRRGDALGSPEESLTPRKRGRLIAVAQEFLQAHAEYAARAWRIDLMAIQLDRAGRVARMDVIKSAVEE